MDPEVQLVREILVHQLSPSLLFALDCLLIAFVLLIAQEVQGVLEVLGHPFLLLILGNSSPCYPLLLEIREIQAAPVNLQVLDAQLDPVFLGDQADLVNPGDLVVLNPPFVLVEKKE